ncbi:DEAD/DEAH box helicase [Termitidicoccus mucosus]|uniref:DEAD-box ATP-dependent RNA helicase RhpA n=1 Tax=Termitidicoccus mucosus TaxID=1184151 RepID=A0A178IHF5_9BACT|nr:DEAD/DEAH box helicase [Opitutaceae bacterium TSB47]
MQHLRFAELGLSPEILKAVDKMGFEETSPIQTAAIPPILEGRDLVGQSSTGSGKTAAFAIPAVEKTDPKNRAVQVLVLCPTRELAVQVSEEVAKISLFKRGVHAVPIFGGQSYERQFRALASGVQIVIGTPGRVLDHMERGTLKLDSLKLLVLDEADRMLDMGFREDIERVLSQAPAERQFLFFSATMPRAIQELIRRYSRDPQWVKIEAQAQNAPKVDQVYFEVERRSKLEVLTRLIDMHDFSYGIVFCSTKIMVDELNDHLQARGYAVERLHGDISQAQRTRVMEKFRRRGFEFLIATDVAARGLDVDDLEVVFNFDLPNDAEDYTHRIGRTGRAGKSGRAFTFVSGRELYKLQSMVRYGKLNLRRERVPSLDLVEEARENQFFEKLRATLDDGAFAKQDRIIDRLLEQGYTSTDIIAALIHIMQGDGKPAAAPKKQEREPCDNGGTASVPSAARQRAQRDTGVPPVDGAPRRQSQDHGQAARAAPRDAAAAPANRARDKHDLAQTFSPEDDTCDPGEPGPARPSKQKYERPARTGREAGFATLFFNVGRKDLVTPADIVGKVTGVTRLPASVVGAIDIHQRHTLVDVDENEAAFIVQKMEGIRVKGAVLKPALADMS